MLLLFLLIAAFINIVTCIPHSMNGTVYYNESSKSYYIKLGVIDCTKGVSCGFFNDSLNETGWGILEIVTDSSSSSSLFNDYQRMYSAGILEGYLTSYEIVPNYNNLKLLFPTEIEYQNDLINWTLTQREWINEQISSNSDDKYWQYIQLLMAQFDGLVDGYNMAANDFNLVALDEWAFQFMTGNQDLYDVLNKLHPSLRKKWNEMSEKEAFEESMKQGHCSAIVKITPELDNIFFAHSTWTSYGTMNRIYKHYIIDLNLEMPTKHFQMSSYPGSLNSIDDFYLMDSGLAVSETTNNIYNTSLYDLLSPYTLFSWQRVRIACQLASTPKEFVDIIAKYNSGTYNNQWIALNWKAFKPNEPLPDDILWIIEFIPVNYASMDVTNVLERGHWPSYNVPAIPYIYQVSGNEEMAMEKGTSFSYDLAPRARIFRRDADSAYNMTSLMKFMRYNNYLNDAIENNDPLWAIMARGDLQSDGDCFGGLDTKITDYEMMTKGLVYVQSGPTHDDLPVFEYTSQWQSCPHEGLPQKFNFDWVLMKSQMLETPIKQTKQTNK